MSDHGLETHIQIIPNSIFQFLFYIKLFIVTGKSHRSAHFQTSLVKACLQQSREISIIGFNCYVMTAIAFGWVDAINLLMYPKRFYMIVK